MLSVLESEEEKIRLPGNSLDKKLTIPKTEINNEYQNYL